MPVASDTGLWHRVESALARVRPYRQPLSLLIDGVVVAACWNVTYLFRLGFERWINARPSYDGWVLLGVVATYLLVFAVAKVPRGMWRFSGFGDIKRLTLACFVAGLLCAGWVIGASLTKVPRAVLAVHGASPCCPPSTRGATERTHGTGQVRIDRTLPALCSRMRWS